MTRRERFPDTKTFTYYNANPFGRLTEDCVFRALTLALGQDYTSTILEMAEVQARTGYALNGRKGIELYLKAKGWTKYPQPRKSDGTKYTAAEFCEEIAEANNTYILVLANHVVTVKDCKVFDTWNSTRKTVGNYYTI